MQLGKITKASTAVCVTLDSKRKKKLCDSELCNNTFEKSFHTPHKQLTFSFQMPSLLYRWPENWPNWQSLPRWKAEGSVKQFQLCTAEWKGNLFTSRRVRRKTELQWVILQNIRPLIIRSPSDQFSFWQNIRGNTEYLPSLAIKVIHGWQVTW